MTNFLKPSDIAFEALRKAKEYVHTLSDKDGTHTDISLRPLQGKVGIAHGAEYNMALIYDCYDHAAQKLGVENPLIPTPHPYAQYVYCNTHAERIVKKIFVPRKRFGVICANEQEINPELLKEADLFLMQTKEGLWHCGFISKIERNRVITLETSRFGLKYFKRGFSQIKKIIRIC